MRKLMMGVLVSVLAVGSLVAGGNAEKKSGSAKTENGGMKPQRLTLAGSEATDSLLAKMAQQFSDYVNANGKDVGLSINYIKGNTLGTINDVLQQQIQGGVDISFVRPLWFSSYLKDFQVLSWGFTFRSREHLNQFYASPLFAGMMDQVRKETGLVFLGATADQARVLFARKPIRTAADLKGLKMRVPGIEAYVKLWQTMGTLPTQVDWAEAFLALKTGVVDAAEADVAGAWSQKFHVAAPYITMTEHVISGASFMVNGQRFQNLSAEQQKLLRDASEHALKWLDVESVSAADKILDKMKAEGATVLTIDKTELQQLSSAGAKQMESEGLWPAGLWQKIQQVGS